MSSNGDGDDSGPGTREVAHRLFAAEFDDASLEYSESDEERAPNYVVTPTGLRVNRLFAVGVLTEVESVNEETVRGRVVDPTGAFVTYAGQYQPDELAFLDRTTPPAFVALTGKARTFQPEDSDVVYTSVRPESISEVDAHTRDRWTVSAAEATLDRLAVLAAALDLDERGDALRARLEAAGAPEALAAGIPRALEHYGTTPAYVEAVRRLAVDALEVVAGERDEVRPLEADPDSPGPTEIGPLPDHGLDLAAESEGPTEEPATEPTATTESAAGTEEPAEAAAAGDEEAATAAGSTTVPPSASDAESTEPTESADSAEAEELAEEPTEVAAAGAADSTAVTGADADAGSPAEGEAGTEPETGQAGSTAAAATEDDVDAVATEPDAPSESPDGSDGELGDFDDGGLGDFEDADAEDFEDAISEEERREVEEEHGVEFSTGSEVSDPGEADIETPEPEAAESEDLTGDAGGTTEEAEPEEADPEEAAAEPTAEEPTTEESSADEPADGEPAADVDLEDAVVDLMEELDEGDGADRDAVVSTAAERFGVTADEADDAVQDALMSGKCYEPSEGTLKSI